MFLHNLAPRPGGEPYPEFIEPLLPGYMQVAAAATGWGFAMTTQERPEAEKLLTPAEVAALFRVDPKTVTRWAKAGKLTSIRTLGGHRRYRESEVRKLLAGL
jgi:excisionase family DNA binding protein